MPSLASDWRPTHENSWSSWRLVVRMSASRGKRRAGQPHVSRFAPGDGAPRQQQVRRPRQTQHPGEDGVRSQLGDHAPAHEGERDLGVFGHEADVGQQRVGDAHPHGVAVDGGDDRLVQLPRQPGGHVGGVAAGLVGGVVERRAAGLEVGSRTERPACPRQHDGPHGVVVVSRVQGPAQFSRQPRVPRVEALGPVEGDDGDPVALVAEDGVVGHGAGVAGRHRRRDPSSTNRRREVVGMTMVTPTPRGFAAWNARGARPCNDSHRRGAR